MAILASWRFKNFVLGWYAMTRFVGGCYVFQNAACCQASVVVSSVVIAIPAPRSAPLDRRPRGIRVPVRGFAFGGFCFWASPLSSGTGFTFIVGQFFRLGEEKAGKAGQCSTRPQAGEDGLEAREYSTNFGDSTLARIIHEGFVLT